MAFSVAYGLFSQLLGSRKGISEALDLTISQLQLLLQHLNWRETVYFLLFGYFPL